MHGGLPRKREHSKTNVLFVGSYALRVVCGRSEAAILDSLVQDVAILGSWPVIPIMTGKTTP